MKFTFFMHKYDLQYQTILTKWLKVKDHHCTKNFQNTQRTLQVHI